MSSDWSSGDQYDDFDFSTRIDSSRLDHLMDAFLMVKE